MTEEQAQAVVDASEYTCEYRKKSCPIYYAKTSMNLDPGMREFVEAWYKGGWKEAHTFLARKKGDKDE